LFCKRLTPYGVHYAESRMCPAPTSARVRTAMAPTVQGLHSDLAAVLVLRAALHLDEDLLLLGAVVAFLLRASGFQNAKSPRASRWSTATAEVREAESGAEGPFAGLPTCIILPSHR